ncbi:hypothetical protein PVAP13_4KG107405 [Panicum virgatum]|uniref:Uncharacterized protein n=1 Tax=Panicum virgatum TaxID=38727 RepID=A0A8T0TUY4_PANVG|nr:hypothetical protein PVAP13_4KG107405 [Panicum virgatum]
MAGGAMVAPAAGGRQDYPGGLILFVFTACLIAATGGLRLRHRRLRRRHVHGPVPREVLPVRVPQAAGGGGGGGPRRQPVLHVRQPAADNLHVLHLPLRARRVAARRDLHPRRGPQVVHVLRRGHLPRRQRPQRRRGRRPHAHPGPRPTGPRRRLRQPERAAVPVGDGARQDARDAQQRLQPHDHRRHPARHARQLRHAEDRRRLGLAAQPRAHGRPSRRHRRRLLLPPRHAQLPPGARPARGGEADAPPGARRRGRRRRVQRPRGGQRSVQGRDAPLARHPAAPVPPAAGDGGGHPDVPAAHGHRAPDLRAGSVQDGGLRRRRVAHVRGDHRPRQPPGHLRVGAHRGPDRAARAAPAGRAADAGQHGGYGRPDGRHARVRRHGGDAGGVRDGHGGGDVRVHRGVLVVVGPAGLAGAERSDAAGGAARGAEHHGGGEHAHELRGGAGVPAPLLPPQARALLRLRRPASRHDALRRAVPAGDQGGAHRGHGRRLEGALVLETLCQRR